METGTSETGTQGTNISELEGGTQETNKPESEGGKQSKEGDKSILGITKEQFEARIERAKQSAVKKYIVDLEQKKQKEMTEAERLKGLNETQKAQLQLENAQKRIAELEKANALADMTKQASLQLTDKLSMSVDADSLGFLVSEDADTTQANVDKFAQIVSDLADKKFKQASRGDTPNGFGGSKQSYAEKLAKQANSQKNVEFKNSLFK